MKKKPVELRTKRVGNFVAMNEILANRYAKRKTTI